MNDTNCARCGLPDPGGHHILNPSACIAALKERNELAAIAATMSPVSKLLEEKDREIARLREDKARLDWLEEDLRSTGRGDISINPSDYITVRTANLIARHEEAPRTQTNGTSSWPYTEELNWPMTEGRAQSLRSAIDRARPLAPFTNHIPPESKFANYGGKGNESAFPRST